MKFKITLVNMIVSFVDTAENSDTTKEVDIESYIDPEAKWQTGFLTQYVALCKRNFLRQKGRYFSKLNFLQVFFTAIFAGLVWIQTPRNEETARDRLGIVSILTPDSRFT
jgi:hypothetical protein